MAINPELDSAARIRNLLPQEAQFRAESIGNEIAGYNQAHLQGTAAAFEAIKAANATFQKAGIYGLGSPKATTDQLQTIAAIHGLEATHDASHFAEAAAAVSKPARTR